jgi:hypothetical protein
VIISVHVQNLHSFIDQVIISFIFFITTASSSFPNQLKSITELIDECIPMMQEIKPDNNLFRMKDDYKTSVTSSDDDDIDYIA